MSFLYGHSVISWQLIDTHFKGTTDYQSQCKPLTVNHYEENRLALSLEGVLYFHTHSGHWYRVYRKTLKKYCQTQNKFTDSSPINIYI